MLELKAYFDRRWKSWVVLVLDENGDQRFASRYYPNKAALAWGLQND